MNRSYKLGELIKWFSLVGSIAFSMGAAKKGGMNFFETLHIVESQNKQIISSQAEIIEEQAAAKYEREGLRSVIREINRASKTTKGQIKTLGRNYAYLTHKLDPLEN